MCQGVILGLDCFSRLVSKIHNDKLIEPVPMDLSPTVNLDQLKRYMVHSNPVD